MNTSRQGRETFWRRGGRESYICQRLTTIKRLDGSTYLDYHLAGPASPHLALIHPRIFSVSIVVLDTDLWYSLEYEIV